jgi:nucleotide-binding universal stress UspA family protein
VRSFTILHPTDFCGFCEPAFRLACGRAAEHKARLVVLHVAPPPVYGILASLAQQYHRLWNRLHRLRAPQEAVHVEHLLRCGDPAAEILRVARAHDRTWLRRLLRGSVAEAVTRAAPCDVLTVPALSPARTRPRTPALARAKEYI